MTAIYGPSKIVAFFGGMLAALPVPAQPASTANEAYFRFQNQGSSDSFVIRLLDPARIQQARDMIAGVTPHKSIKGTIVKAPAFYSEPWTFHLDPRSIEFFDFAAEVCDSSIRGVQDHLEQVGGSFLPGNDWCPWSSRLVAEIAPPPGAEQAIAVVSTASYSEVAIAPASIASVFGKSLTDRTETASQMPLPESLAGVSIEIEAAGGTPSPTRYRPGLWFASPSQVNFVAPDDLPDGVLKVTMHTADGRTLSTFSRGERLAPGIFHIGPEPAGFAAATLLRVRPDGTQTREPLVARDPGTGQLAPMPIRFGSNSDQLVLELYATGLRKSSAGAVSARIDGESLPVRFSGPQGASPGLDQVNLELPRTLSNRKEVQFKLDIGKDGGGAAEDTNEIRLIFNETAPSSSMLMDSHFFIKNRSVQ